MKEKEYPGWMVSARHRKQPSMRNTPEETMAPAVPTGSPPERSICIPTHQQVITVGDAQSPPLSPACGKSHPCLCDCLPTPAPATHNVHLQHAGRGRSKGALLPSPKALFQGASNPRSKALLWSQRTNHCELPR